MKIDLIWNGGIGTYIKSIKETHLDVGDRANDVLITDTIKTIDNENGIRVSAKFILLSLE